MMVAFIVVGLLVLLLAVWVAASQIAWVLSGGGRPRGLAPGFEVLRTMSATAVRLRGRHTRPSLPITWRTPVREVGIELAWTGLRFWRRWLYAAVEDVVLVFAPPRTGKTALLAAQAQDAPGSCLITSTRPDIHEHTVAARSAIGPVAVFNPEDVGGVESTVRWDPVAGCDDPAQAIMRAGYLLSGAPATGVSNREYWEGQAHRTLRCLLMAAALDGKDMRSVVRWASLEHDRPVEVLKAARAAPGWADELRAAQALVPKTRDAISSTLTLALQFMAVPALAHAATPPRGQGLDVADFLARRGTLYLLGAQREHAPIAPLLAAFTGHLFETAKSTAARQRGGRLDPPLTLVLDEAARVCRVPLERWTADAGGSGIPIIIAVQGPDQLYDVWGQDAGATIWTNAAVKVAFGGLQSGRHLDELSKLCGLRWHLRDGKLERVPVLEPAQIVQLADLEVLVLRKNTGPVLGWIRPVWARRPPPQPRAGPAPDRDWTGPLATVIRLADWRRRRDQRERDAS